MRRMAVVASAAIASVVAAMAFAGTAVADTTFRGTWLCNWKVGGDYLAMAGARVELLTPYVDLDEYDVPGNFRVVGVTHTDQDGNWSFTFPSDEDGDDYWVRVLTNGNGVRMHDLLMPWPFFVDSDRNQNDVPLHDYGRIVIHTYRCEVWTGLQRAYDDYVATTGRRPPYGDLDVVSHAITAGTPVTMFTDIWWPADVPVGPDPARADLAHGSGPGFGLETAFHEFGHSFRHAIDAPDPGLPRLDLARAHFFFGDVPYWNYAQKHSACKKTNSGFAFNEGWASYWAGYYSDGRAPTCPGIGATDYSVEGNVTAALHRLQSFCNVSRAQMVDVLRSRSGQLLPTAPIHTFDQFAAAAERRFAESGSCLRDRIFESPPTGARTELSPSLSFAGELRGQRRELNTVIRAAAREFAQARQDVRRSAPCARNPCLPRLDRAIHVPLAKGRLQTARLVKRVTVKWSARERRVIRGRPGQRYLKLMTARERRLRNASKAIAKRMFRSMIETARPIVRRDGSARAKAILGFLQASLRRVSAGRLPAGLIPTPGRGTITAIGPAAPAVPEPPPPPPAPPEPPPAQEPPPPPAQPDLVVDEITGFGTSSDPSLRITVRNAGNADAPATKLSLHTRRSTDGAEGDKLLDVPALPAGGSTTVNSGVCDPYGLDSATATADATALVAESNESNNSLSASGGLCRYP